jgi:hypothetical protein
MLQEVHCFVNIGPENLTMYWGHGLLQDVFGGGGYISKLEQPDSLIFSDRLRVARIEEYIILI